MAKKAEGGVAGHEFGMSYLRTICQKQREIYSEIAG